MIFILFCYLWKCDVQEVTPSDSESHNQRFCNYLYVYNADGLKFINVRGVFEDPEDLSKYDCDGSDCYDSDSDFPIPMDMLQTITQGIMSGELMMLSTSVNDTTNDTLKDAAAVLAEESAPTEFQ